MELALLALLEEHPLVLAVLGLVRQGSERAQPLAPALVSLHPGWLH